MFLMSLLIFGLSAFEWNLSAAPAPSASGIPYTNPAPGPSLGEGTGFFRVVEKDGRWWFADPDGNAFFVVATDHISYDAHWCQDLGYAPYHRLVSDKYGSETAWSEIQANRLRAWGFNTLGVNHSHPLRRMGFPYPELASFGTAFSAVDDLCPRTWWTGFPNVFSPDWPRHCDETARVITAEFRNDPWLLGYMIDNELEWYGKSGTEWGLFDEVWKKPAGHTAKQAWVAFLREHLDGIDAFAEHWGVEPDSWEALARHTEPALPRTDTARKLAREWVRLIAERYFAETAGALRRHDPNHLVLGTRFPGQAPGVWDIAGRHCDVVTFNLYPRVSVETGVPAEMYEEINEWYAQANKPLWVTEWSFPALDAGLPSTHGAGMRVDTQEQRARCFTHFQEAMFRLPFMVGSSYFMYIDQPELGFSHDFPENSNYGLINGNDQPYPELTGAAKALNPRAIEIHAEGNPEPTAPLRLASWLTELPTESIDVQSVSAGIEAGDLIFGDPSEGRIRVSWRGQLLGHWHPLLEISDAGQVHWLAPDTGTVTRVLHNDHITVVFVIFSVQGNDHIPGYRAEYELWIPNDRPWFATRLTSVRNSSDRLWTAGRVFHTFTPSLGGSPADDTTMDPVVPDYHVNGDAWVDPVSGLGVGCLIPPDAPYLAQYWKDEAFHADVYLTIDKELPPAGSVVSEAPPVFFYPFDPPSRAGFGAAAVETAREVLIP